MRWVPGIVLSMFRAGTVRAAQQPSEVGLSECGSLSVGFDTRHTLTLLLMTPGRLQSGNDPTLPPSPGLSWVDQVTPA